MFRVSSQPNVLGIDSSLEVHPSRATNPASSLSPGTRSDLLIPGTSIFVGLLLLLALMLTSWNY